MTFWELLALMSAMATILGIWLAVYALINNRTLKTESRLVRESLERESAETKEILDRIDKVIERGFKDSIEVTREQGAQTRSLIKTTS